MRFVHLLHLLIVFALLLPSALAAPASGQVRIEGPLTWQGTVDASGARGFIDLGPSAAASSEFALEWASASGYLVTRAQDWVGAPGAEVRRTDPPPVNDSITLSEGRLVDLECVGPCRVILFSDDVGGRISGTLPPTGGLSPLGSEVTHQGGLRGEGAPDSFFIRAPADWVAIDNPDGSEVRGEGRVSLYLWNVTGAFETAAGRQAFVTGWTTSPTTAPGGISTGHHEEGKFLVLHLTSGAVSASNVADARILASSARIAVDGAFDSGHATGRVITDSTEVSARDDHLRLEGTFTLDVTTMTDSGLLTRRAASLFASISGDVTTVAINEEEFAMGRNLAPLVAGGFVVALLTILGALGPSHVPGIPFYTRIDRSNTLRNPNRKTIYEAILASPGENVASLVRATELTEVVVRHHLKMLESHRFVIARGEGRQYAYFAVEQQNEALEADAFITLRDATRRLVAETLLQAPRPMSQKDLAAYLDISQRLVSHHIIKLESEGLVDSMGSMPRRYFATPRLTTVLGSVGEAVAA